LQSAVRQSVPPHPTNQESGRLVCQRPSGGTGGCYAVRTSCRDRCSGTGCRGSSSRSRPACSRTSGP
jgi:hypothetical protein